MGFFPLNKRKLVVSVIIGGVAAIGDKNSEEQKNRLAAAIVDNVTHGLIGGFTWIGIFISKTHSFDVKFCGEVLLSALCSSLIDADHFVAARSFHLKDATTLKSRPFLHCTTFAASISTIILALSRFYKINWLYKFGWILVSAFTSHHIRDSKRRGFWLWPFGSTPPLPNLLYLAAQMLLPHSMSIFMTSFFVFDKFVSEFDNVEVV